MAGREGQRLTERETETVREREKDRETDRQTDRTSELQKPRAGTGASSRWGTRARKAPSSLGAQCR